MSTLENDRNFFNEIFNETKIKVIKMIPLSSAAFFSAAVRASVKDFCSFSNLLCLSLDSSYNIDKYHVIYNPDNFWMVSIKRNLSSLDHGLVLHSTGFWLSVNIPFSIGWKGLNFIELTLTWPVTYEDFFSWIHVLHVLSPRPNIS